MRYETRFFYQLPSINKYVYIKSILNRTFGGIPDYLMICNMYVYETEFNPPPPRPIFTEISLTRYFFSIDVIPKGFKF